jgi:hypothetical protein
MAGHFNLDDQIQIVRHVLHWKRRQFTELQVEQLESIERTLFGLKSIRQKLIATKSNGHSDPEKVMDDLANELVDLLHLERA